MLFTVYQPLFPLSPVPELLILSLLPQPHPPIRPHTSVLLYMLLLLPLLRHILTLLLKSSSDVKGA